MSFTDLGTEFGKKNGDYIIPTRFAVTGETRRTFRLGRVYVSVTHPSDKELKSAYLCSTNYGSDSIGLITPEGFNVYIDISSPKSRKATKASKRKAGKK